MCCRYAAIRTPSSLYLVCRQIEILLGLDDFPDLAHAESKGIPRQSIPAHMYQGVLTCSNQGFIIVLPVQAQATMLIPSCLQAQCRDRMCQQGMSNIYTNPMYIYKRHLQAASIMQQHKTTARCTGIIYGMMEDSGVQTRACEMQDRMPEMPHISPQ